MPRQLAREGKKKGKGKLGSPEERAQARMERRIARSKKAEQAREKRRARLLESAAATGAYVCREVPGYDLEARAPQRELVVMFSSGQRFSLYKHDFERDVLFVSDQSHEYYLMRAVEIAQAILDAIEHKNYERVLFAGFSKGGFGALSIARICAALAPERVFHVAAFSPQVQLHPRNEKLYFWSYGVLCDSAEKRPELAAAMRRFGDVSLIGEMPNVCTTVVYGRQSETDSAEALRITGPNAVMRPVEGMFHGTHIYFLSKNVGRKKLIARITKIYSNTDDRDAQQTKPDDISQMVDDILASVNEQPTLNDLFGELMAERKPVVTTMSPALEEFVAFVRQAASSAVAHRRSTAPSRATEAA